MPNKLDRLIINPDNREHGDSHEEDTLKRWQCMDDSVVAAMYAGDGSVDTKQVIACSALGVTNRIKNAARVQYPDKVGKYTITQAAKKPMATAATPAKTTDDLFKGLEDFKSTFGGLVGGLKDQVNTLNNKVNDVGNEVSKSQDQSSGTSTSTILLAGGALLALLFFLRK